MHDVSIKIDIPAKFSLSPHPAFSTLGNITSFDSNHPVKIFTDGSVSTNGSGSAFCVLSDSQVIRCSDFKLDKNCSITQAELFALKEAFNYIFKCRLRNVLICTDSQTSVLILSNPPIKSKFYFDTYQLFQKCILKFNTKICWIKGHSGCAGNELADLLATSAYLNSTVFSPPLPMSFARRKLHDESIKLWNNRWNLDNKGFITHMFFPTIHDRLNIDLTNQNFILTQFLSGHGKFNNYLFRFKILNSGDCNCGNNDPDSIPHILFDCKLFDRWRRRLINYFTGKLISWPIDCSELVKDQEILTIFKTCVIECSSSYGPSSS